MINWKPITNHYNLIRMRRFSTAEMLEYLYRNIGNVEKVADYLGVSTTTLTRKMDSLNVPRMRKPPWPESVQSKIAVIPTKKLSTMTAKEIASYVGYHPGSIYRALDIDGREYKRAKPQYKER